MGANIEIAKIDNLVLYDGVCNFCNNSVNFIIKHEKDQELQFASLQSELGNAVLKRHNLNSQNFDSIVFVQRGQVFQKSKGALKIAGFLKAPLSWIKAFGILPVWFTDIFYDIIAKNRYKIFGKSDTCQIPSPELRSRFLDQSTPVA